MPVRGVKDSSYTWKLLKDPNFLLKEKCQRAKTPRDLALLGFYLKNDTDLHNYFFENLMSRKWPPMTIVSVIKTWLTDFDSSIDPSKIKLFNAFHYRYGSYVNDNASKIKSLKEQV